METHMWKTLDILQSFKLDFDKLKSSVKEKGNYTTTTETHMAKCAVKDGWKI